MEDAITSGFQNISGLAQGRLGPQADSLRVGAAGDVCAARLALVRGDRMRLRGVFREAAESTSPGPSGGAGLDQPLAKSDSSAPSRRSTALQYELTARNGSQAAVLRLDEDLTSAWGRPA